MRIYLPLVNMDQVKTIKTMENVNKMKVTSGNLSSET